MFSRIYQGRFLNSPKLRSLDQLRALELEKGQGLLNEFPPEMKTASHNFDEAGRWYLALYHQDASDAGLTTT